MKFKSVDAARAGGVGGKGRRRRAGAPVLRRRGVGSACSPRRRRRRSNGRARRCSWRAAAARSRSLPPAELRAWNDRRLQALQTIDYPTEGALPAALLGRLRLRRAEAFAWRAFDEARRGNADAAARAEGAAVRELALADRGVLAPEDVDAYEDVAVRVAASRWATEAPAKRRRQARRQPGRRAARRGRDLRARGRTARQGAAASRERCTYGVVWQNALRWAPSGTAATIAVQPLAAWSELWVVRRAGDASWAFETLTPATTDPDVTAGYVESAGFSPDGGRLLVVREARGGGQVTRRFQVMATRDAGRRDAGPRSADKLGAFKRWSAPSWRAGTLALR